MTTQLPHLVEAWLSAPHLRSCRSHHQSMADKHPVRGPRSGPAQVERPVCLKLKRKSGGVSPYFYNHNRFNRSMSVRPGPGRKSKGDRDNFAVKPMRPVGDVIRANADRLGMTYGEYCAALLSTALGMPEYAPQPVTSEQQELPLKTA